MKNPSQKSPIIDVVPSRGKMTSALWSCELHRELCFTRAAVAATLPEPARDQHSPMLVAQRPQDGRLAIGTLIYCEI